MTTGSGNDVDTFTYDPNTDRPTNLTYSINPTPSTGDYHVTTQLTWNANWSLQKMVYTDGNDATKDQTCTYSADDLSRIASTSCGTSTWGQTFTYDPFGNIKKTIPSGYSGTAYAAAYSTVTNQVSSGITPTPTYDKNGNQTTSTPATLTWNALNQPITVNSTSATYDALGRMVEKGLSGTYTQFVFRPSGTILAVYSGSLVKGTIPLPGGSTAIYNASGLSYIRHTDWLGSSRLATTWQHAVYSKEAYAPFGETYNEAGTADRSFTGQDQDVVTGSGGSGVYDYLFRKYDPSAGRWLSPDPLGWGAVNQTDPQSLNRYAYVENQPMSNVDPTGQWMCFSGVSSGGVLEVDPGMTCWSNSYGYSVEADSAGSFTFNDDGTIQQASTFTDNNGSTTTLNGFAGYWSEIDVINGFTNTNGQIIPYAPNNGTGTAPSNGPSYSRADICGASALLNKGVKTLGTTLLDAIGIIPGEGNALKAVQLGAGLLSGGVTVADSNSSWAGFGFSGGGLGLSVVDSSGLKFNAKLFGEGFSVVPVLGNFLSLGATANDIFGENEMSEYYDACMAGKN